MTLRNMSKQDATTALASRNRIPSAWLMAVAAFLLVAVAYVVHFGGCDTQSKFCYLSAAGTRSEVVVAWLDGPEVYTQTYPAE